MTHPPRSGTVYDMALRTHTIPAGIRPARRLEEAPMFTTPAVVTDAETEAREFAAAYPTPQVLRAIELAEAGRLAWGPVRDLFARSLGEALEVVA